MRTKWSLPKTFAVILCTISLCVSAHSEQGAYEEYVLESYGAENYLDMPDRVAFSIYVGRVAGAKGKSGDSASYHLARSLGIQPEYGGVGKLSEEQRSRLAYLGKHLRNVDREMQQAATKARFESVCEIPDPPVDSDTLLERLERPDLAPLEVAEVELEKFKAILTQGEREYFRYYLVDSVKQGSSYTRISNRSFIEPELKGMSEADRYAAVWIRFSELCANLNRDTSQ